LNQQADGRKSGVKGEGKMEWDYRIEEVQFGIGPMADVEALLNKVGTEGWEAVSALPLTINSPGAVYLLFKRLKSK
jgi:hypothetical protein